MSEDFYGDLAPLYDRMIPWERRLARETPWFEELLRRTGARRVLDAACGSGGHLALLAGLDLDALAGADASPAMLDLARRRLDAIPESRRPRLVEAAWAELPEKVPGLFDLVLCLGNSLPYVTDDAALRAALAGLWSRVALGGLLLIQFKNFARRKGGDDRFLPPTACRDADGTEHVFVRLYDWRGELVDFNVLILSRRPGKPWSLRQLVTPLRPWSADRITGELCALGARVRSFGSLALDPLDPALSEDVVLWAMKPKD